MCFLIRTASHSAPYIEIGDVAYDFRIWPKKHCSSISIGSFWPTRLPGMPRLVLGASRDCVGEVLQHVNRAIRLKPGEVVEFYSKSWENHPFSIVRFVENIVREREN